VRVLVVIPPIAKTVYGGAAIQARCTADAMQKLGAHVEVATTDKPNARGFDIAHIFGISDAHVLSLQIKSCHEMATPVAVSPIWCSWREVSARALRAVDVLRLYRLPRGDRVYDAIAAAGGFSPDADMSRVPNLAGRLKDGEQVKVPFAKTTSGTVVVRTNLNTATVEELAAVPCFTDAFAQECIDYRTNFGGFQNTRELVDILGMSEAEYVIARRYLTL